MDITGAFVSIQSVDKYTSGAFRALRTGWVGDLGAGAVIGGEKIEFQASRSWTGSTNSASPYTAQMGSGTPLSINPEHITVKAWKRLS
ncbi:hypothetical protein I6E17_08910 [Fusobacterium perfoetens]|uniref:hypothetical protein n=1 Tax=Fusobacterium perfoetens TaxID=852 RepID=UPI001F26F0EB|nr:hypothetical protein [Fusobacterium perfoetens]MCF2626271.1 hypothetical protein [Fusobacterium perfoetens]